MYFYPTNRKKNINLLIMLLLMFILPMSVSARDYYIQASDGEVYTITVGEGIDIADFSITKPDGEKLLGVTNEERVIATELYSASKILRIIRIHYSPNTPIVNWVENVRVIGEDALKNLNLRQFATVLGSNSFSIITTLTTGGTTTLVNIGLDVLSEINGAIANDQERRLMADAYFLALTMAVHIQAHEQALRNFWLSWETRSIVISMDEIESAWENFYRSGEHGLVVDYLINTYLQVPDFLERINNFFQSFVPIAAKIGTLESLMYTNHHLQQLKALKTEIETKIQIRVQERMTTEKQASRAALEQAGFFSPLQEPTEPSDLNEPIRRTDQITYTTLITQTDSILTVSFSPNRSNNTLAFGTADNLIHLRNTDTGEHLYTLRGHTNYVLNVAFSHDGQILASSDANGTVHVWNAQSGNLQYTLRGHTNSVLSLAFSSDGQTLASASLDGSIRLWNYDTGQHKNTLTGNLTPILSVAFSPDGHTLASGNADGTIHLWNVNNRRIMQTLRRHTDYVLSVAFSPDGQTLASSSADGTVQIWDTQTGTIKHTLTAHTDWGQ